MTKGFEKELENLVRYLEKNLIKEKIKIEKSKEPLPKVNRFYQDLKQKGIEIPNEFVITYKKGGDKERIKKIKKVSPLLDEYLETIPRREDIITKLKESFIKKKPRRVKKEKPVEREILSYEELQKLFDFSEEELNENLRLYITRQQVEAKEVNRETITNFLEKEGYLLKDLADMLNLSLPGLHSAIRTKRFKVIQFGPRGKYYATKKAIENYLLERKKPTINTNNAAKLLGLEPTQVRYAANQLDIRTEERGRERLLNGIDYHKLKNHFQKKNKI